MKLSEWKKEERKKRKKVSCAGLLFREKRRL
jgi:hypothetical protein